MTGKLLKDIPHLIVTHCVALRMNLAISDLWKQERELVELNSAVYNIVKYFSRSNKRIIILEAKEAEELDEQLKLIKPIDIRWLSHFKAIKRILETYSTIVKALEEIIKLEGDAIVLGLKKIMKLSKFVF